jgi:hypothetical protein
LLARENDSEAGKQGNPGRTKKSWGRTGVGFRVQTNRQFVTSMLTLSRFPSIIAYLSPVQIQSLMGLAFRSTDASVGPPGSLAPASAHHAGFNLRARSSSASAVAVAVLTLFLL